MKRILQNTFLAVGLVMILPFVITLGSSSSLVAAIVISLFFLFCAVFPTYLCVLIYYYVKRKIATNKVYTAIIGTLLLLFIYHICLLLFFIIIWRGPWSDFLSTVMLEYTDEHGILNILAILLAIAVPVADLLIDKIEKDLKEYK
ncbi:hypothetical protein [Chitinophaga pinensis]|uniref:Uncharacterized protein n=1 Tax=Chitinophaga pinensis (strain ATCC 43595 / DSM 2588 / LMG 13176 / NBRC 15968 / NCIMB 11800 / UQM 2034) TaxID=485918 RepID=A0A979GRP8_CHIPD|nr:hypothetical protein [Chitinophaga pinensis]ACU62497.1 hypothetical protein Cpin_5065 [Chitinophaga pinensis DSM 2588]